jgi:hypothetical protein
MSDSKKTPLHSAEEKHLMERKTSRKLFSRPGYFMKTVMRRLKNATKTMDKQMKSSKRVAPLFLRTVFWPGGQVHC